MGKLKSITANIRSVWTDLRERRNEEGLTLIELMVVVVILGIIAAIAIPSISGAINNAKKNTTISDLSTVQEAIQRYYVDNGSYPVTGSLITDLTTSSNGNGPYINGTTIGSSTYLVDAWNNPVYYLEVSDPSTGASGYYLVSGGSTGKLTVGGTAPTTISSNYIYTSGGSGADGKSIYQSPTVASSGGASIDGTGTFSDQ